MSGTNKFLGSGGNDVNISNGTTKIFGSTIGAANLRPSYPVKTDSQNNLVSTKLYISDVENLQQKLNSAITNPFYGTLRVQDLETKNYTSAEDEFKK